MYRIIGTQIYMLICILSKFTLYDSRVGYMGVGQERHEGQFRLFNPKNDLSIAFFKKF